jgi:ribosomal protein S18 acetylase RimI-like enzyme
MAGVLTIHQADPKDAALVLEFIVELEKFEQQHEEIKGTNPSVEDLRRALRPAANPRWHVYIAMLDAAPVAMGAYYLAYSTSRATWAMHLQDFIVREAYRERGVGTRLLRHFAGIAKARNYGAIEFEVLTWNDGAIEFYKRAGAVANDKASLMYIEDDALEALAKQ